MVDTDRIQSEPLRNEGSEHAGSDSAVSGNAVAIAGVGAGVVAVAVEVAVDAQDVLQHRKYLVVHAGRPVNAVEQCANTELSCSPVVRFKRAATIELNG